MPTPYFAFNTLGGCQRSSPLVIEATTAGRFDATHVARGIQMAGSNSGYIFRQQPFMNGGAAITGTLYLRWDTYYTSNNSNGINLLTLQNGLVNVFGITRLGQPQYWNSVTNAWVNWGTAATLPNDVLLTIVLKLTPGTSFELYVNGVLVSSGAAPVNMNNQVTYFQWGAGNVSSATWVSQAMCADYDLTLSNYSEKALAANGTYTDGTGAVADVNETPTNDNTIINLPAVGNKKTFTKAAVTVPGSRVIAGLVVNARGRVGGGVVTDGKLRIRSGATDAASGAKGYSASIEPRGHFFATDPATAAAWATAGLNAAEVGVEAA